MIYIIRERKENDSIKEKKKRKTLRATQTLVISCIIALVLCFHKARKEKVNVKFAISDVHKILTIVNLVLKCQKFLLKVIEMKISVSMDNGKSFLIWETLMLFS